MIAAILNSANLNSAILHQKTSLVHSDSTWWWQLSRTLPSWIQTLSSWIQTPCYLLSDSLKNILPPFWHSLKLIQSDSNSFILTQHDDGSHLEYCHFGNLGFNHFSFSSQTHSHLPRLVPNICTKKLHSFILTQLDDCSYLEICHPQFSHFVQKILYSFILTQLDDGSHLEFCQLEFHHLGFNHFSFSSQTHSHLPRLVPNICTKKLHSFILTQLDDGSHLEFYHVGFRHCHLECRHLVIFSQIHSNTFSLLSDSDSN